MNEEGDDPKSVTCGADSHRGGLCPDKDWARWVALMVQTDKGFDQTAWPSTPDITLPSHTPEQKHVLPLPCQCGYSMKWLRNQIIQHYQLPLSRWGQRGLQHSPQLRRSPACLCVECYICSTFKDQQMFVEWVCQAGVGTHVLMLSWYTFVSDGWLYRGYGGKTEKVQVVD